MGLIILGIAMLVLGFKLTWFFLRLTGKALGIVLSVAGYIILGVLIVVLSIPLIFMPILAVVGLVALITGFDRV